MGSQPFALFIFLFYLTCYSVLNSAFAVDVSYMESNIGHFSSGGKYVDLVAGVTQASVSRTMSEFIATLDTTPQTFAYKYENDAYVYVSEEEAYEELGFNLMDLPDGICYDDSEDLQKAFQLGYRYGVRLAYGYPEGVDPSVIPEPIILDNAGFIVTYNMVMSTFDLLGMFPDPMTFKPCTSVYSQDTYLEENPGAVPYYFSWKVNLDLNTDNLNEDLLDKLPDEAVDVINNVGLSMFSVDQLFLDLNSALLIYGSVNIPGLSQDDPMYFFLTNFLQTFVTTVDPNGDGVLLGFSVNQEDYVDYETIFVPSKMNFQVSEHLNSDGNPSGETDLNTLNYWVSVNGHDLAPPQVFPYNWIEQSDLDKGFDGVMSISREMISTKLNLALRDELTNTLCYDVDTTMTTCIDTTCSGGRGWCYGFRTDLNPCANTEYEIADGDNGLALTFHKLDEQYSTCDKYYPDFWARFKMRCESWSNIYFEGNQIRMENEIMVDVSNSCEYGSAGTNGTAAHYLSTTLYDITISDDAGEIKVDFVSTDSEDKSETLEIDFGTCTEESVTETQNHIQQQMDDLQDTFTSYTDALKQILNGQQWFVFPGGNTFSFEDVIFSNYGDLMAHIKYRPVS